MGEQLETGANSARSHFPKASPEKPRISTAKRIFSFLRPHRAPFVGAIICMAVFGATDGIVPFLVKYVLDGVFTDKNVQLLWILPIALMVFAIVRAASDFGQQYLISTVGHRVTRDVRNAINQHVLKLSPDFFIRHSSAELLSRITSDVLLVRMLLTDSSAAVIRDLIRVIALFFSCVYLDPQLTLLAVCFFPLAGYPIARIGKKMRRLSKRGQDAIGELSRIFQESMLGHRVVKVFCREGLEVERFERENESLTKTFVKSERIRAAAGPINELLGAVIISSVLLFGGYSVIHGTRTQGDFIAFLLAVFLLYDPFKKLTRMNATLQQGIVGADRIFEVLDTKPSIVEVSSPQPLSSSHKIEIRNVSFHYESLSENSENVVALKAVSATIEEGRKTALVGFSGSGKSTFVDLLPRFVDPQEGEVLLGGVSVRELSLASLRSQIAMVGQHTFLFNDTVYANLAYGREGATREEIEAAARAAYASDFIERLSAGYNTVLGEGGMSLSGGERQRLAIARALLKNAPILIFDEATASLDNRSEREVQMAIEALEKGRTTIVIAHRLSTVQDADTILVMSAGKIVERGTHTELLGLGGEYAKLHALQFRETGEAA